MTVSCLCNSLSDDLGMSHDIPQSHLLPRYTPHPLTPPRIKKKKSRKLFTYLFIACVLIYGLQLFFLYTFRILLEIFMISVTIPFLRPSLTKIATKKPRMTLP